MVGKNAVPANHSLRIYVERRAHNHDTKASQGGGGDADALGGKVVVSGSQAPMSGRDMWTLVGIRMGMSSASFQY